MKTERSVAAGGRGSAVSFQKQTRPQSGENFKAQRDISDEDIQRRISFWDEGFFSSSPQLTVFIDWCDVFTPKSTHESIRCFWTILNETEANVLSGFTALLCLRSVLMFLSQLELLSCFESPSHVPCCFGLARFVLQNHTHETATRFQTRGCRKWWAFYELTLGLSYQDHFETEFVCF